MKVSAVEGTPLNGPHLALCCTSIVSPKGISLNGHRLSSLGLHRFFYIIQCNKSVSRNCSV